MINFRELVETYHHMQAELSESTNLTKHNFSREFIRALFGTVNIMHDAEIETSSRKPSTSMLDDFVILVQAKDGGEYAYFRPSANTSNKSFIQILRTIGGKTNLMNPDELETGKNIINGKYFLIPISGSNGRRRLGPKVRHNTNLPGARKASGKSDSIFTNDVEISEVMKHLKRVFFPRLEKKSSDLLDKIYGVLRHLNTTKQGSMLWSDSKSDAQKALDYVEEINKLVKSAYGTKGSRIYFPGESDGLVQLMRFVQKYDKENKDSISISTAARGILNYDLMDKEQASILLRKDPQIRFKIVQAVEASLDTIERKVDGLIQRNQR